MLLDYPAIWLTLGTATDGAGTLSGQVSHRTQLALDESSAIQDYNCAFAGGTNWLAISMFYDAATHGHGSCITFFLERLRNVSGEETDDGLVVHFAKQKYGNLYGLRWQQIVPTSGVVPEYTWDNNDNPKWPMMIPPANITDGYLGDYTFGLCTLHPWSGIHYPAILGAVVYFNMGPDIENFTLFGVDRYGSPHTYLRARQHSTLWSFTGHRNSP